MLVKISFIPPKKNASYAPVDTDEMYWLTSNGENVVVTQKDASTALDSSLPNCQAPVVFYRLGRFGLPYRVFSVSTKFEFAGK